ncbi:D-TA family PLP-dependent enzyme [Salmonirosea aquatica]|uniref:D-TA family PLP-dependent enzyme n=1 Tax=Salmonirosea aquatica TaxID=2654236 RepID=A0A7C9BFH2_9BACT|nr:D-TA family PLP-dependent enzyme [Cytophagaceae bacterium SJW1-29]
MQTDTWYEVHNPNQIFSPSLLVYKERIEFNIALMIQIAGSADRLVPHVKTHKMAEVTQLQLEAGITKFKCATIAEAEMLAQTGAKWILIAYQLVGPNIERLFALQNKYPEVYFASLVDSHASAQQLSKSSAGRVSNVFIDVNNGMDRSGFPIHHGLLELYQEIAQMDHLQLQGLHVYDGHIREAVFAERKAHSDAAFKPIQQIQTSLKQAGYPAPMIIAGGSPTFTVHAQRTAVYCSPGTCLLWDWGYGERFLDQPFQHAAVIATRVISKPAENIITIDLGHKAVAAENPIDRRFKFLNLDRYEVLSQSEEHGVVRVAHWDRIQLGDLLYALPYHICPTVALHEYAAVVENHTVLDKWPILARRRIISV